MDLCSCLRGCSLVRTPGDRKHDARCNALACSVPSASASQTITQQMHSATGSLHDLENIQGLVELGSEMMIEMLAKRNETC